jgi:hypothetical protein
MVAGLLPGGLECHICMSQIAVCVAVALWVPVAVTSTSEHLETWR